MHFYLFVTEMYHDLKRCLHKKLQQHIKEGPACSLPTTSFPGYLSTAQSLSLLDITHLVPKLSLAAPSSGPWPPSQPGPGLPEGVDLLGAAQVLLDLAV